MAEALCGCGCGLKAPVAPRSSTEKGWTRGEPVRFVHGHNRRKERTVPTEKCCPRCESVKSASAFYADKTKSDGLSSYCKTCRKFVSSESFRANPQKHLTRMQKWRKVNAGRQSSLAADYEARKLNAFVEHVSRCQVWERNQGLCGICGEDADLDNFHVDHIVALARGGEHSYANTQVAHPSCNQRKHANEISHVYIRSI